MLLRRITEHVKAQNWTAIAIDFVIVVFGVFIGIQVSNWNEGRQNTDLTQSYYNRLIDDLDAERRALQARVEYINVTDRYGQSALLAMGDPSAMQTSQFLVALYQASQIWTYSVQRATYDEILSSGIAGVIPDSELRAHLGNFYRAAEEIRQVIVDTTPYRQQIRLYLPNDIQSAIREHCGDMYVSLERSLQVLTLPETCDIEFTDDQISAALAALDDYQLLERELVQRLASLSITRITIQTNLPRIDTLIDQIQTRQR
jgi:hypothetical protein